MKPRIVGRASAARWGAAFAVVMVLHGWALQRLSGPGFEAARVPLVPRPAMRFRGVMLPQALSEPSGGPESGADASTTGHERRAARLAAAHRQPASDGRSTSDPVPASHGAAAVPPMSAAPPVPAPSEAPMRDAAPPRSAPSIGRPDDAASAVEASGPVPLPSHRPPAPAGEVVVPVYATQLPPSARWRYRFTQGDTVGTAELRWQRDGDRYDASLAGVADTLAAPLLDWTSRGAIDAAGIAPERFVDRRKGRAAQAANFQRDSSKISYSAKSADMPLPPGAQDRLSWLPQLAGVVAAEPARFKPGSPLVLYVSGAHGDAQVWRFVVQGIDIVEGRPLLKLRRDADWLYDLQVEVWLDTARNAWPVRWRMANGGYRLDMQAVGAD